jgi:hypothetical protein
MVAVVAVHGLDMSSRHSARQGVPANFEIQRGFVDNDSEEYGNVTPSRYAR